MEKCHFGKSIFAMRKKLMIKKESERQPQEKIILPIKEAPLIRLSADFSVETLWDRRK